MALSKEEEDKLKAGAKDKKYLTVLGQIAESVKDKESAQIVAKSLDKLSEVMSIVPETDDNSEALVSILKEIQISNEKLGNDNNNDVLVQNLENLTKDLVISNKQSVDAFTLVADELNSVKLLLEDAKNAKWVFTFERDSNTDIHKIGAERTA